MTFEQMLNSDESGEQINRGESLPDNQELSGEVEISDLDPRTREELYRDLESGSEEDEDGGEGYVSPNSLI
jgi:uncharacterized membrane protein